MRKLPPSLRERAEATGAWRASPELFEFLAHLLGDERSKAWFILFENVRELWEYLTRWLEYVAASLPHGVSPQQVDMPRLTREGGLSAERPDLLACLTPRARPRCALLRLR